MKNVEFYENQIKELGIYNLAVDKETGVPCACKVTFCENCLIHAMCTPEKLCSHVVSDWLLAEHDGTKSEPKPKPDSNVIWSKKSSFEKDGLGIVVEVNDEGSESKFNETVLEYVEYLGRHDILHLCFIDNGHLYISSQMANIGINSNLRNGKFSLT